MSSKRSKSFVQNNTTHPLPPLLYLFTPYVYMKAFENFCLVSVSKRKKRKCDKKLQKKNNVKAVINNNQG